MGSAGLEWNGGENKVGSVGGCHGLSIRTLDSDGLIGGSTVEAGAPSWFCIVVLVIPQKEYDDDDAPSSWCWLPS
jgi:hypothetical protein